MTLTLPRGAMIIAVLACDPSGTLGNQGTLPWQLPQELRFFRALVQGHPLIMGRKTYESLPRRLPDRPYYVFSRQNSFKPSNVHVFSSLKAFQENRPSGALFFMIGGAEITDLFAKANLLDYAILSHIHATYKGEVHVNLDFLKAWKHTCFYNSKIFDVLCYTYPGGDLNSQALKGNGF